MIGQLSQLIRPLCCVRFLLDWSADATIMFLLSWSADDRYNCKVTVKQWGFLSKKDLFNFEFFDITLAIPLYSLTRKEVDLQAINDSIVNINSP